MKLRWLNTRLKLDTLMTNQSRFGSLATDKKLVIKTWDGVLMDNLHLPLDWTRQSEVLVGIGKLRPPGRNR
jgi:ribonuclease HI